MPSNTRYNIAVYLLLIHATIVFLITTMRKSRNSGGQRRNHQATAPRNRPSTNQNTNKQAAIAINQKLVELGKKKQWNELLLFAEQKRASFNNVNYATVMSQLGRIGSFNKKDPHFLAFLQALAAIIEERGLPWIETAASCQHCPCHWENEVEESEYQENTRVDLKARSSSNICNGRISAGQLPMLPGLVQHSGLTAPSLFARLNISRIGLCRLEIHRDVANTAWACATLGFQSTKLFAAD